MRHIAVWLTASFLIAGLCACTPQRVQTDTTTPRNFYTTSTETDEESTTTFATVTTTTAVTTSAKSNERTTATGTTTVLTTTTTAKRATSTVKSTLHTTATTSPSTVTTGRSSVTVPSTTTQQTALSQITTSVTTAATTAAVQPEKITPLTALDPTEYYGYVLLGKEENGIQLQAAYRRIAEGVEAMSETIAVTEEDERITYEELEKVWEYYRLDYPQHFWVGGSFGMWFEDNEAFASPTYRMSKDERDARRKAMETTVNSLLSGISGSWSEYRRELAIHDALCNFLTYQENGTASHNADGALVDGLAVCEGYAEAFQYLLYRAGIQCLGVSGLGNGEGHKWNVVRIDGHYYHVDVTWDDPVGETSIIYYGYFNLSEALLKRDHTIEEDGYPLPPCQVTTHNYFKQNGGWITEFSVDAVAAHLKNKGGKAEFYIVDKTAHEFTHWVFDNLNSLYEKTGLTSLESISFTDYSVKVIMN